MFKKLKKGFLIFALLIFVSVVALFINNKKMLLYLNGCRNNSIVLLNATNNNNNNCQIIQTTENDKIKLLYIEKRNLGIWHLFESSIESEDYPATIILPKSIIAAPGVLEWKYDIIFAGSSQGYIDVNYNNLPLNTALNFYHDQTNYRFHFVSFSNEDLNESEDTFTLITDFMNKTLYDNGYIKENN